MTFANPGYLFLLLLLIPVVGWYIWKLRHARASVQLSSTDSLQRQPKSVRVWLIHVPFALRVGVITLLSLALARPQLSNRWQSESTEGIDIMMALDISGTMLGEDLKPNRLEAAKAVATDFVLSRPNDQIGLVVFAGESFTQCPLTTDHAVLVNLFQSVKFGMIEDGTAIGLGLANAVNRMKDSETKSKVVILLTDGSNNRGDIDPMTAAEIAKTFNIRVYAIGVGSYSKEVRVPIYTPYGVQYGTMSSEFDESTLRNIAQMTGGEYFRATDNNSLKAIYQQIDQLEKTKIRVREYSKRTEHFAPFLLAALLCLLTELLLRFFVLRTISE
ncbi:MAG: VWA domain-containing protein [Paludibacteraceae bacterium]|nr:VWA domain-containing protein [Paludibacteraceae bacterium]